MFALPAVRVAARLPRTATVRRALVTALFVAGLLALALLLGDRAEAASAEWEERPDRLLETPRQPERSEAFTPRDDALETARSGQRLDPVAGTALATSPPPTAAPAERSTAPIETTLRNASDTLRDQLTGHRGSRPEDDRGHVTNRHGSDRPVRSCDPDLLRSPDAGLGSGTTRSSSLVDQFDERRTDDSRSEHDAPAPFSPPQSPFPLTVTSSAGEGGESRAQDHHGSDALFRTPQPVLLCGAVSTTGGTPTRERHRDILEFPG